MRRLVGELVGAFLLLTRLPVGWLLAGRAPGGLADGIWAYPLAGAAVGGIGAAVFAVACALGLPASVAAVWTLAATALASGALHEDGLADTADGLGGGRSRAGKLEIMHDSRIGTFGALALIVALAARASALAAMAGPWRVAAALVAAGALSRGAMLLPLLVLAPARTDGLGAGLRERGALRAAAGFVLAATIGLAVLPPALALRAAAAALAAALVLAWLARRHLGGYTGDVLGATAVLAECAALAAGGVWRVNP